MRHRSWYRSLLLHCRLQLLLRRSLRGRSPHLPVSVPVPVPRLVLVLVSRAEVLLRRAVVQLTARAAYLRLKRAFFHLLADLLSLRYLLLQLPFIFLQIFLLAVLQHHPLLVQLRPARARRIRVLLCLLLYQPDLLIQLRNVREQQPLLLLVHLVQLLQLSALLLLVLLLDVGRRDGFHGLLDGLAANVTARGARDVYLLRLDRFVEVGLLQHSLDRLWRFELLRAQLVAVLGPLYLVFDDSLALPVELGRLLVAELVVGAWLFLLILNS